MIWLLMMILTIYIKEKPLMKYMIRAFNIAKSPEFDGY